MTSKQSSLDAIAVLEAIQATDVQTVRSILDDCDTEGLVWSLAALTLGMGIAIHHMADHPARAFMSSLRSKTDLATGEFQP